MPFIHTTAKMYHSHKKMSLRCLPTQGQTIKIGMIGVRKTIDPKKEVRYSSAPKRIPFEISFHVIVTDCWFWKQYRQQKIMFYKWYINANPS